MTVWDDLLHAWAREAGAKLDPRSMWYRLADDGATPIPCDVAEFSRWRQWNTPEGADRARVAVMTRDRVTVSTVFLGLDHQYGDGPPLLWETLVMGGIFDGEIDHYASRAEAEAGHAARCREVFGVDA